MGAHHTKDKGDLGTAMAYADLVSQGCMVLFPATEHAPFDLVAYRSGRFHRVQVKYRTARSGKVVVSFRSSWADRHGTHRSRSTRPRSTRCASTAPTRTSATTCVPATTTKL